MNETTRKSGKTATTKARALRFAKGAQDLLSKAEERALDAARRRDEAVATAKGLGATYADLQGATGLSSTRLTTILRRSRS